MVEADGHDRVRLRPVARAHVFLESRAADTLDDKVLDAMQDERGVRFAVTDQHPPGLLQARPPPGRSAD